MMGLFLLHRRHDVTGVSGEGIVAAGMGFPDGHVTMRWLVGEHRSSVTWESMDAVKAIHGHNGSTEVIPLASIDWRRADNRFGTDVRLWGPGVKGLFLPTYGRPQTDRASVVSMSDLEPELYRRNAVFTKISAQ